MRVNRFIRPNSSVEAKTALFNPTFLKEDPLYPLEASIFIFVSVFQEVEGLGRGWQ